MQRQNNASKLLAGLVAVGTLAMSAGAASAAVKTWNGNTANWFDSAEWTTSGVPDIVTPNDTVVINAGTVNYIPGGDFVNNSVVTVGAGATWQQSSSIAWMKFGDSGKTGTLNVSGTFDVGGAQNLFVGNGGTATINVTGGLLKANTLINASGSSIVVSGGGTVTAGSVALNAGSSFQLNGTGSSLDIGTNEIKPNGVDLLVIDGGTLKANRIGFDGAGAYSVELISGRIELADGAGFDGIFSLGADDYVDFTGTSGSLFLGGAATTGNANALLTSGRVRYNGVTDPSQFLVTPGSGGGAEITLNVPEPASLAALGLATVLFGRRRRV